MEFRKRLELIFDITSVEDIWMFGAIDSYQRSLHSIECYYQHFPTIGCDRVTLAVHRMFVAFCCMADHRTHLSCRCEYAQRLRKTFEIVNV